MIRKFYDTEYIDKASSSMYVIDAQETDKSVIIECECGAHMLKITHMATIYTLEGGGKQTDQSLYLAMFNYGNGKRGFWGRLKIAWDYLKTGKMFSDQLSLTSDEAKKAANFINNNIIEI